MKQLHDGAGLIKVHAMPSVLDQAEVSLLSVREHASIEANLVLDWVLERVFSVDEHGWSVVAPVIWEAKQRLLAVIKRLDVNGKRGIWVQVELEGMA